MPELSIVIGHYRSPDELTKCLNSLTAGLDGISAEVFVCDSASTDSTQVGIDKARDSVGALPLTLIPFADNVGFARLINAGITQSHGEFVLVLNADTVATPRCIADLVGYLKLNADVGVVAPTLIDADGAELQSAFRFPRPSSIAARRTPYARTSMGASELRRFTYAAELGDPVVRDLDVDWIAGAAFLVRKTVIDEVGSLDPGYFMYFEDVDFCRRVRNAGHRVVLLRSAQVQHDEGHGSRGESVLRSVLLNPLTRAHLKSASRYFRKFGVRA